MKESDELFKLIKSMSKEEKRYFKISSEDVDHKRTYIQFFDIVNNSDNYDEDAIKKKIKGSNFRNLKHNLFNSIVESIKNMHAGKSIKNNIREDIESIELLVWRNIYDTSKKLLQKNIQKTLEVENYEQFLNLMEQQLTYDGATSHKDSTLELIHQQRNDINYGKTRLPNMGQKLG